MIPLGEHLDGVTELARRHKRLGDTLIRRLDRDATALSLPASHDTFSHDLSDHRLYLLRGGNLTLRYQGRSLLVWDEGDLILPAPDQALEYRSDGAVLLAGYDYAAALETWLAAPESARLWSELLMVRQALFLRLLAARSPDHAAPYSEFRYFAPGDALIRQGEPADCLYHLFEGEADVLVDEVVVGRVRAGELLGAIALLTGAGRGATVRARTRCSAMRVPGDRFQQLIRANPALIQALMTDMARQITALNGQVVALSAP